MIGFPFFIANSGTVNTIAWRAIYSIKNGTISFVLLIYVSFCRGNLLLASRHFSPDIAINMLSDVAIDERSTINRNVTVKN